MEKSIQLLADKLLLNNLTICSAESLTGGLFASELTNVKGISKIFKGTIVAYQNDIKNELLNVNKQTLEEFGAVSKQTALEMVKNAAKIFNTKIAVAFTGNAGPSVSEGKEVGLVYIGYQIFEEVYVKQYHFQGSRKQIRQACVIEASKEIINKV